MLISYFESYRDWEESLFNWTAPVFKKDTGNGPLLGLICVVSFFVGVTAWLPLNYIFKKAPFLDAAITEQGDMETLLHHAVASGKAISITLDSDKVYVGFVKKSFEPKATGTPAAWILPLMSGYRDDEKRIQFTTFYESIYAQSKFDVDDFQIVIPISTIVSANFFDFDTYHEFQRVRSPALTSAQLHAERKAWRKANPKG